MVPWDMGSLKCSLIFLGDCKLVLTPGKSTIVVGRSSVLSTRSKSGAFSLSELVPSMRSCFLLFNKNSFSFGSESYFSFIFNDLG